ncbi:MAG: TatD family hydrolase [Candidatus Magasanikbacteria bacterium]|jgi:TatD DNase family protein|nr:TatD family hydrolase [Candidatus Magasanikbacteria bacterium]MBT4350770.1 TatD family hydrolase [Candidatus Magasanikbacteria bacterium]MBT4541554.1 TatD family hydrolase [Candidatus Magasanikbacteria bacterium]MBT6253506.1 TatD family hydrolase [Candidatus Magasanikbacteria bacterium]MBT6334860.1 TatD family hydrolase [Candidatus Magasanikbacteria bacterium]
MIIDTHCHVQFKAYDEDRNDVLRRSFEKGIVLNVVGTQKDTSKKAVELAEAHDNIYATIGLHPIQEHVVKVVEEDTTFQSRGEAFDVTYYDELATSSKVIAVGETGLDKYHIPKDVSAESIFETQQAVFLAHHAFAVRHDLPLVIHVREAHDEMIALLQTLPQPVKGVVHCFTGNWEQAEAYIGFGLYLGFTGVVTFPPKKTDPNAQLALIDVLHRIPLEKLLVETDSPFLAPQKYRGKRCEPWMVEEVVDFIAHLRGLSVEEVALLSTKNAKTLFSRIQI